MLTSLPPLSMILYPSSLGEDMKIHLSATTMDERVFEQAGRVDFMDELL
ncbi:unnamed protein product [Schistosoma mattheei]|uniref:Uncharacterized protein n=1 Tax=Schistosoma mattheei TaxID=31246 RepID=A0A183PQG7_9TREM|nr:unnamed protein product [Schistosoma mattheei]